MVPHRRKDLTHPRHPLWWQQHGRAGPMVALWIGCGTDGVDKPMVLIRARVPLKSMRSTMGAAAAAHPSADPDPRLPQKRPRSTGGSPVEE